MKQQKLLYLEGLRGIAAVMVFLNHFFLGFYPYLLYPQIPNLRKLAFFDIIVYSPLRIFYNGSFATYFFCILMGYVVALPYIKMRKKEIVVSGLFRRYFRFLLPSAVSLIAGFLLIKYHFLYNDRTVQYTACCLNQYFQGVSADFIELLRQIFLGILFGNTSYNIIVGSIQGFFVGSVIVYSILFVFGHLKWRFIAYGLILLFMGFHPRITFVLGMIICDLQHTFKRKITANALLTFELLIIVFFTGSFPQGFHTDSTIWKLLNIHFTDPANFAYIIGSLFLLILILISPVLQKVFSSKILVYLGKISIGIYLTHFLIINSFSSFLFLWLIQKISYDGAVLVSFAATVQLVGISSYFFYRSIDIPSHQFPKYLWKKTVGKYYPSITSQFPFLA